MISELLTIFIVPFAWVTLWAIEVCWPARPFVAVPRWFWFGAVSFLMVAVIGSIVPFLWDASKLFSHRFVDLSGLGWWGLPIGIIVVSFVFYWWHRAAHRFDLLWRTSHQLHHSALRVDILGAFYTHPLEVFIKSSISFTVGIGLLGLSPSVASAVASTSALLSMFQHWNIHTPRWLGWIFSRPEMHGLHHEYGVHGRNYGDLPLWDMLFGTYVNPIEFNARVGFDPKRSVRLADMLLMRDVHASVQD